MSMSSEALGDEVPESPAENAGDSGAVDYSAEGEAEPAAALPEAVEVVHAPIEVGLQRSVRFGRILIVASALGAIIGAVISLFFPVAEDADYELGQAVGLMVVVGAAVGLALGAILSLFLGFLASRNTGAAIAVQTDVR